MMKQLNWPSLESRRKTLKVTMMFKIKKIDG